QYADPAERIFAVVHGEHAGRNARPADAVKAVAAADEVAGKFLRPALIIEADLRLSAGEVVHAHVADFEQDLPAIGEPARHQILDDLLLAVDGHALADQLAKIDVMQRSVEAEIDAVVEHRLALHALADTGLDQEIARPLLDQPGADPALDVFAVAVLQDD